MSPQEKDQTPDVTGRSALVTRQADRFGSGLSLPLRAVSFLRANPKLLLLALAPALLGLAAWLGGTVAFVTWGDDLLTRWWAAPETLESFAKLGWYLAWVAMTLVVPVVAGFFASRVLAAPILDALAERTMKVLGRRIHESTFLELVGGFGLALTRLGFFVGVQALLFVTNLIPGGVVVGAPMNVAFSGLWIFADTLQPALDAVGKRGVWPALSLFRASPARATGFTAIAAGLSFIPFLGALLTPLLVVAGALFVADVVEERSP